MLGLSWSSVFLSHPLTLSLSPTAWACSCLCVCVCIKTKVCFRVLPTFIYPHKIILVMKCFVPTGWWWVGHTVPHSLCGTVPLEKVQRFPTIIKLSPNLIVKVCPVYGGQKQVVTFGSIFGSIFLIRWRRNVEFLSLPRLVKHKYSQAFIRHRENLLYKIFILTANLCRTHLSRCVSSLVSTELLGGVTHIALVSAVFGAGVAIVTM